MNTIKIDDEHLQLIQEALELYIRCSIGQFERIMDLASIDKWYNKQDKVKQYYFTDDLKNLHYSYTGSYNGGPGIYNKEQVTDDAREAMHIHDQIRHHLWKKKHCQCDSMESNFTYDNLPSDWCTNCGKKSSKNKHIVDAYDAMIKLIEIK